MLSEESAGACICGMHIYDLISRLIKYLMVTVSTPFGARPALTGERERVAVQVPVADLLRLISSDACPHAATAQPP